MNIGIEDELGPDQVSREQELEEKLRNLWGSFFGITKFDLRVRQLPSEVGYSQRSLRLGRRDQEREISRKLQGELKEQLEKLAPGQRVYTSISHSQAEPSNPGDPLLHTPLSHGRGGWIVAVGATRPIGVDLEFSSRAVHPGLGAKIIHESEKQWYLSPLETWVIKEAVFKANPQNENTVLSHYHIIEWDPAKRVGKAELAKQVNCMFHCATFENWIIAVAVG